MRLSASLLVLAISSGVLAAPLGHIQQKRALSCASKDDTGSALQSTGTDGENTVCVYATAGHCEYFAENGTFSNGASTCPSGLTDGTAPPPPSQVATPPTPPPKATSTPATSTSTSAKANFTPNKNLACPSTDDKGSKLTSTGTDGENVVCNYETSPDCEYFSENGTFSSGSSTCPKGLIAASSSSTNASSSASSTTTSVSSPPPTKTTSSVITTTSAAITTTRSSSASSSSSLSSSSSAPASSSSAAPPAALSAGAVVFETPLVPAPASPTAAVPAPASASAPAVAFSTDAVFFTTPLTPGPQATAPAAPAGSAPANNNGASAAKGPLDPTVQLKSGASRLGVRSTSSWMAVGATVVASWAWLAL